jgi:hypothetical protein
MSVLQKRIVLTIVLAGLPSAGLSGCGPSEGGVTGTGGGAGISGGSAGSTGAAGTGGTQGSAGSTGAAGSMAGGAGGSTGGTLGVAGAAGNGGGGATGGAGAAGAGATAGASAASGGAGGASRTGGRGGGGGASGMAGFGGTSGGGTGGTGGTGTCVRDQINPSEVVFIGDSFIALGNNIPNALHANARAAGSLGQNETYRNNAVSGTLLGNGQIPGQYNSAVNASPVKVVLMNGGGNDCLQANNPGPAYTAAMSLFQTMAQEGTQSVVYFFYPDPLGSFASGNLKPCLDGLRPMMKSLCEGLTAPKCYFIDLRSGWNMSHTTDGIHTTAAGGEFVADKVWAVMQQNCIAQ